MSVLSKLPAILSSLAVANSVALPIVLKKDSQAKSEEFKNIEIVETVKPERRKMPRDANGRWKEAMQYIDCVDEQYKNKELTEELKTKIKQDCRAKHWFWD